MRTRTGNHQPMTERFTAIAGQPTRATRAASAPTPRAKRTMPRTLRERRFPVPEGAAGRSEDSREAPARAPAAGFMRGSEGSGDPDGQKRFQFLGKWEGDILLHRLELFDGLNTQLLAAERHDLLHQDLGGRGARGQAENAHAFEPLGADVAR